jgi:hypothetical protein
LRTRCVITVETNAANQKGQPGFARYALKPRLDGECEGGILPATSKLRFAASCIVTYKTRAQNRTPPLVQADCA